MGENQKQKYPVSRALIFPFQFWRKGQKGFSMIELLAVIFIISLISGLIAISYWNSQKQYSVSKAAQRLAVDLRRVQNMALSGATQGAVAPRGYGLYVQSAGQYLLFYNANADTVYNDSSVSLGATALENAALSPVGASIYFVPPAPTTFINGVNGGSQTFIISSGGRSKSVVVDFGGKIDID